MKNNMIYYTSTIIADFILDMSFDCLSSSTIDHTKNTLIDTIACAIGGYNSPPGQISRRLAHSVQGIDIPSRILGETNTSSPEMAAFANTTMIRYLDCNDSYFSPGGGHPSDMIGGALTLTHALNCSGKDLLTSIVLGYEIFAKLSDQVIVSNLGWDQGVFLGLSAAGIACKLLKLSKEQILHALSLSVVPNLPIGATRVGELSMWKGCATASAVKSGVFAALLAREGLTSPEKPFDGPRGLWEQLGCDNNITIDKLDAQGKRPKICDNIFKFYPSQIHTQAPIGLACQLSSIIQTDDIDSISIKSYRQGGVSTPQSEPEKWAPSTRETADHSIPFLVASALLDGTVNPDTFSDTNLNRDSIKELISVTSIEENLNFSSLYPEQYNCRIDLATKSGRTHMVETSYPKGHQKNPFSQTDLEHKFINLTSNSISLEQCQQALNILDHIELEQSTNTLFDSVVVTNRTK